MKERNVFSWAPNNISHARTTQLFNPPKLNSKRQVTTGAPFIRPRSASQVPWPCLSDLLFLVMKTSNQFPSMTWATDCWIEQSRHCVVKNDPCLPLELRNAFQGRWEPPQRETCNCIYATTTTTETWIRLWFIIMPHCPAITTTANKVMIHNYVALPS